MQENEIRQKAEEYISLEQNEYFRKQIEDLLKAENWEELNERFYKDLDFGTGGLRGEIGGGYNRMNAFTVKKATQGLANYIAKNVDESKRIAAIAYDSRNFSDLFAMEAALVLCGQGIKTYLFTSLRPTPELSYAVRKLGAVAGIVVTASHNPKQYNGYKVYWDDGAQVTPPHDKGIIEEVRKVTDDVVALSEKEALDKGLLVMIDKEIDEPYMAMVESQALRPELIKEKGRDMKIVYTPLHGTGAFLVESVLSRMGIEVSTVPEQREPDGDFPTVDFPNPEITPAMQMSLDLAKKEKADLVMGTDPDSDRLGIAVPEGDDYVLVTGNQLGALLADYIFATRKELGTLPEKPVLINTIVTSDLQNLIAESYGAESFKVLTGFKFICGLMREFEEKKTGQEYVFGGEESYGYLVGTEVRDKDAVSAATMTAEMALWNVAAGRSVLDHLNDIYKRFGYFQEHLISKYFEGQSGGQYMDSLMVQLRETPPSAWGGLKISEYRDYADSTFKKAGSNETGRIDLPSSNVLQWVLEDGSMLTARPSGTEPKIKFYISCRSEAGLELQEARKICSGKIDDITAQIQEILK